MSNYIPNEKEESILSELEIGGDLEAEFRDQASLFARWCFLHARALDEKRKYEEMLDLEFYRRYAQAKDELGSGSKENECKAFVKAGKKYQQIQIRLRRAKYNRDIFKAAVDAFATKKDMLQQLGPMMRKELEAIHMGKPKKLAQQSLDSAVADANAMVRKGFNTKKGKKSDG